jgi:hypothetical protein
VKSSDNTLILYKYKYYHISENPNPTPAECEALEELTIETLKRFRSRTPPAYHMMIAHLLVHIPEQLKV